MQRWVMAVALAIFMAGCAGGSTTPTSVSAKAKATAKPSTKPAPAASDDGFVEQVVATQAPTRDGHALAFGGMDPADGIGANVTAKSTVNADGTTTASVTFAYTPDPPDERITLSVPATSLGARVTGVVVSYTADGKDQAVPDVQVPIPPTVIQPGKNDPIAVPIGTLELKALYANGKRPTTLTAKVSFVGDDGTAIQGEDGQPLVVEVPFDLGGAS